LIFKRRIVKYPYIFAKEGRNSCKAKILSPVRGGLKKKNLFHEKMKKVKSPPIGYVSKEM